MPAISDLTSMIKSSFDKIGFLSVQSFPAILVNQGRLFYHSEVTALNNTSRIIHVKTGKNPVYMAASLQAGLAATAKLLENPTVTAEGTAIEILNYNRDYPDDALQMKLYHTPTVTGSTGKQIKDNQAGFGTAPGHGQAGSAGYERVYKLKAFSSYVYTITMTGSSDIILGLEFYE